jgi:hypothetical protein
MSISTLTGQSIVGITPVGARRVMRLTGVVAAALAALTVWTIAELAFGIDLQAPAFDGSGKTSAISALDVMVVATLLSLAGWALLALLERLTQYVRRVWLIVAPLVLILSLATPLMGSGVTAANRVVLLLVHLAVGTILIPTLARTSPSHE